MPWAAPAASPPGFCLAGSVRGIASPQRPARASLATAAPPSRCWFLPHCARAASPCCACRSACPASVGGTG